MNTLRLLVRVALTAGVVLSTSARAGTFTTLYTFTNTSDGATPVGRLVYNNGFIYGVNLGGNGNGVLFKLDVTTHAFSVVYQFTNASGDGPTDLIYHGGMFYGTTIDGGTKKGGTVFAFDPDKGIETVLYSFPIERDNESSMALGLVYQADTLYGVTQNGGTGGYGSVFSIDLQSESETTLYNFTGRADGAGPGPNLIFENRLLYGSTLFGGGKNCGKGNSGCGLVFTVNPKTGAENVLHAFAPGPGGYLPNSNIVYHKGLLYGATTYGGQKSCGRGGCGTLFSIDPTTGSETVLSTLLSTSQSIFGIMAHGPDLYLTGHGAERQLRNMNAGQLARFNLKSGHRTVLYKFEHGSDGADGSQPEAPLVYGNGAFYGSTPTGGANCGNYGCGTIFQYVP